MRRIRGFTLVELIVVMVILALLAAMLVPSLVKYIKKGNENEIISKAQVVYLAAQSAVTEQYQLDKNFADGCNKTAPNGEKVGSVTNFTLNYYQGKLFKNPNIDFTNDSEFKKNKIDSMIALNLLKGINCTVKGASDYDFQAGTRQNPLGKTVNTYSVTSKGAPGIVVTYTKKGKVLYIEFGLDGKLVHIQDNEVTVTENGVYTNLKY